MATQRYRIVSGDESDIHDEPHIAGSRVTVRSVHERIEEGDLDPETFADRHNLDLADVYRALAYYHDHPAVMRRVERQRQQAIDAGRRRAIAGPDDLE